MATMSNAAFRMLLATIKSDEQTTTLPVGRTAFAKVDASDAERLSQFQWRKRGAKYAAALVEGRLVRMHHIVLGTIDSGMVVDHINGDGLDNRRVNLRVCLPSQNAKNRKATAKPHTSRFKGVSWNGRAWVASISVESEDVYLGRFDHEVRAAYEYDRAARRYHGEFARTNAALGLL